MRRFIVMLALALPLCVGCATTKTGSSAVPPVASGIEVSSAPAGTSGAAETVAGGRPDDGGTYRVTYGWAVPSNRVTVPHTVNPPISTPIGVPLPYLAEIRTGDHAGEKPGYGRISYYFRGAFPEYNLQYVGQVLSEAKGDPVPLEGNAKLRIQFVHAQAHDDGGNSTITYAANQHIGFKNLVSYAPAGDYEGYLSYGLGIQVAPNSDQVLPIRVGELKKPDGHGDFFYVIAVDVQLG